MLVARYRRSGVPDRGFGGDGIAVRQFAYPVETARNGAPRTTRDRRGDVLRPDGNRFALAAFRAGGRVAARFGNGGLAPGPSGDLGGLALQRDGRVAPWADPSTAKSVAFTLARYR